MGFLYLVLFCKAEEGKERVRQCQLSPLLSAITALPCGWQ